ncbi:AraC-like ligand binding domain-containing protein [Paraburkholderia fungorum]|uniref:AraC-like ligand binding domain-containing protein n=1 Tax=Paraburkholderia fungorum TaxID=134537 RepID=A0A1H1H9P8_9BURK|nr:AraC family ligand binding domain-containing protein [Paraburkholderia fungorum]SDR22101.1 AraC-like ligand binding domain-containing protein [Paraburkholderia fungorum]
MNPTALPPLFDFAAQLPQRETFRSLLREFAACEPFRSASVDELVLDDDFYRRPLRPEDFTFLQYQKPVRADNVSRLPSLATNRTLLTINELDICRAPGLAADQQQRFSAFYVDKQRIIGAQIRPYLEAYAFDYLGDEAQPGESRETLSTRLSTTIDDEMQFWNLRFDRLLERDFLEEGLRFIVIQRWATLPSRRTALARAAGSCYFDWLDPELRPSLSSRLPDDATFARIAAMCGVTRQTHSYWQFYLPTTLARCNLLYALGSRPDRAFALAGAAFVAEAEHLAFGGALLKACAHIAPGAAAGANMNDLRANLQARFDRTIDTLATQHGEAALHQFAQGVAAAQLLAQRARWDLGEQLDWLSSIETYCEYARRIYDKIEIDFPDIDRDTFIEPHELCSTTHVHNEHRLVVIESGDMLFWGNLGMKLQMHPGDMVLIPDGRLHGSTVESDSCTYHQPIIPDDWIAELTAPPATAAADASRASAVTT